MSIFARAMLDSLRGPIAPLVTAVRTLGWPLGWDMPTGGPASSAGIYFTADAIGHTGYTGTSIWIDPVRDEFVVLLTNRVNPTAANQRHLELRRELHDAVQLALTDMPITSRR